MLPLPALLLRRLRRSELRLRLLAPGLLPAQSTCSQGSASSVVRLSQVTTPLTGLTRWRYFARVTAGATARAPPLLRWALGLAFRHSGTGGRSGRRNASSPQAGHCGRRMTAMPRAFECAGVHRDRPFVDRGRLVQHQPLDDLGRDQPVQRFEHRGLRRERLEGRLLAGDVAQEVVDLPMAAQAVSQAVPAGAAFIRPRPKDGAEQRLHAARPHQRPRRTRLELATIHFREACFEIVVADDDGELGVGGPDTGAALFQMPGQPAVVAFDRDARPRQPLLDPAWRCAERRPPGRPAPIQAVVGGDDVPLGGE